MKSQEVSTLETLFECKHASNFLDTISRHAGHAEEMRLSLFSLRNGCLIPRSYTYKQSKGMDLVKLTGTGMDNWDKDTDSYERYLSVRPEYCRYGCTECGADVKIEKADQIVMKGVKPTPDSKADVISRLRDNEKVIIIKSCAGTFMSILLADPNGHLAAMVATLRLTLAHKFKSMAFVNVIYKHSVNGLFDKSMAVYHEPHAYFGNSCYLNSIMHALISCQPFLDVAVMTRHGSLFTVANRAIREELTERVRRAAVSSVAHLSNASYSNTAKKARESGDLAALKNANQVYERHRFDLKPLKNKVNEDFIALVKGFGDGENGQQNVTDIFRRLVKRSSVIAHDSPIANNYDSGGSVGHFLFNDHLVNGIGHEKNPGTNVYRVNAELRETLWQIFGIRRVLGCVLTCEEEDGLFATEPGLASFREVHELEEEPTTFFVYYGNKEGLMGLSEMVTTCVVTSRSVVLETDKTGSGHVVALVPTNVDGKRSWTLFDDNSSRELTEMDRGDGITSDMAKTMKLYTKAELMGDVKTTNIMMVEKQYVTTLGSITSEFNMDSSRVNTSYYIVRNFMSAMYDYCWLNLTEDDMIEEGKQFRFLVETNRQTYKKSTRDFATNPTLADRMVAPLSSGSGDIREICARNLALGLLLGDLKEVKPGASIPFTEFIKCYRFKKVRDLTGHMALVDVTGERKKVRATIITNCYETCDYKRLKIRGVALIQDDIQL